MTHPTPHHTTPALVGMGVRLPGPDGDVRGPHQMWQALLAGRTAIAPYPSDRWERMLPLLHPQDQKADPWPAALIAWPGFTPAQRWGLRGSDTEHLSPTQILILQVVAEALADAGIDPTTLAGPGTGIYVALSSPDDGLHVFAAGARPTLPELSAGGAGMVATAVSRWLNSRGPLGTYDASCASAMYALNTARRDLTEGVVEAAIVIGVNVLTHPVPTRSFASGGVLALDGQVLPLDAHAHGYARGEAVEVAILRPYAQALEHRDRVYALLTHTAVGADGRSPTVGAPSAPALAELMERTHTGSGVDTDQVPLVLAHGPGTMAGARAEARALKSAYTRPDHDPVLVTSVKGLFGHSEAAAGLTNLLAGALMWHHGGQVPPTTGHTSPPKWLIEHGVRVAAPTDRLPTTGEHHLGVVAQGFSGAIGYALLAPAPIPASAVEPSWETFGAGAVVLPLAGPDQESLWAAADVLADALEEPHTLSAGRVGDHLTRRRTSHGPARVAVVATGTPTAAPWRALAAGEPHRDVVTLAPEGGPWQSVWTFGGHGSAHPTMGATLYTQDAVFARHLDACLEVLAPHTRPQDRWRPGRAPAGLAQIQRATWAVQVAMAHTLTERWGLRPDVVVGHSLGEVAAAHICGALPLEAAAHLVSVRADLLARLSGVGGMVTARMGAAAAHEVTEIHPVDVACYNSPGHIIFSGSQAALDDLVPHLEDRGADPRLLEDSPPAHSRHVDAVLDELASALRGLRPSTRQLAEFVSSARGTTTSGADLGIDYWVHQLGAPVLWEQTLALLGRRAPMSVTEVSPRPVLATPTAHIRARHGLDVAIVAAGTPGDEHRGLAMAAAHAYVCHLPVRWPYPAAAPLDLEPARWHTPPDRAELWHERVWALPASAREGALQEVVTRLVQGLSPVSVTEHDLHTDLKDLGLHSFDRLSLATELLRPWGDGIDQLPDHQPTIASIARAVAALMSGQVPSS